MSNATRKVNRATNQILVPKERVISTGKGCYNCKHWDREAAKPFWDVRRQEELTKVLNVVLDLPDGEPLSAEDCKTPAALQAFNTKAMINSIDHLVASKHVGICRGNGRTANGQPVGDLTTHALFCGQWSGVSGASLASAGHAPDMLPEERADKLNKPS